ncbi:helix-turn-helix domain-containing protein [Actinacidiphila epipremni]|uniref:AraC family transcriptional regulator n=1 Tax=Actinacidiphila epipremni TaxID=2053013 RepID=A0ABX1A476_9ACTN|nr:helix-turn-helix domain-containing protein [Actinacidiphila epipremni]NJP48383.1 AraC family transcriptional regulator [Actinacidiphila epipremni]
MGPVGWEVARPRGVGRVAGVAMAGFRVPGVEAGGLRVVPHPAVMLIVEFGPGGSVVEDAAGRAQRGSLVAGVGFGAGGGVRGRGEDVRCVQVRLSPLDAPRLLGAPAGELGGAMTALEDLWGPEGTRLRERLAEIPSWQGRFAAVDALLARRRAAPGARPAAVDPEVAWAWHRIVAGQGRVRVEELAAEVGWSRKRLWARFQAQTGLPPKRAARLVRFDRAAHRLVTGGAPARVAAAGGYADQSHLHRDVMAFAGVTPAGVTAERFLAVDEFAWPGAAGAAGAPGAAGAALTRPPAAARRSRPGR